MSIDDVKNLLVSIKHSMEHNLITPDEAVSVIHSKNNLVWKNIGMMIDNDLYRNGIVNIKQAKKINKNIPNGYSWFEVYRPWGTTNDLIRPVDKYSVSVALNQMILAINLGNYRETEQMYDMEIFGNKYADLADC